MEKQPGPCLWSPSPLVAPPVRPTPPWPLYAFELVSPDVRLWLDQVWTDLDTIGLTGFFSSGHFEVVLRPLLGFHLKLQRVTSVWSCQCQSRESTSKDRGNRVNVSDRSRDTSTSSPTESRIGVTPHVLPLVPPRSGCTSCHVCC